LPAPVRPRPEGLEVAVRVTPKAARAGIRGTVTDAAGEAWLEIRVGEPAEGGKATAAASAKLADLLGVPKSAVRLTAGPASRWKRFLVMGDPALLMTRLPGA
jgi:uncharacterized protein YggU (UPF0235/DUF167 family)